MEGERWDGTLYRGAGGGRGREVRGWRVGGGGGGRGVDAEGRGEGGGGEVGGAKSYNIKGSEQANTSDLHNPSYNGTISWRCYFFWRIM